MSEQLLLSRLHALIGSGELRNLWADENTWQGLRVDYDPPLVERLENRCIGDGLELVLQRCYPCEDTRSLWYSGLTCPTAVCVLSGALEYRIKHGAQPANVFTLFADASYEVADTQAWYYFRAVGKPCYVVALYGPVPDGLITHGKSLPLNAAEFRDLHATFGDLLAWNDR